MQNTVATILDQAHTAQVFTDEALDPALLERLYHHVRWGPTAMNCSPLRLLYVQSQEAKARLKPCLSLGNVEKTMAAPVTAIAAWDSRFFEHMENLVPHAPNSGEAFAKNLERAEATGVQNATLQIGYWILAARALGLGVGPMAGFDPLAVNAAFFPDGRWRALLLINLGYAQPDRHRPRAPRLDAAQATQVV